MCGRSRGRMLNCFFLLALTRPLSSHLLSCVVFPTPTPNPQISGDFLAYSNNFSSYGNGGGGTDYLEESHKAIRPALEAYKEIMQMLKLE